MQGKKFAGIRFALNRLHSGDKDNSPSGRSVLFIMSLSQEKLLCFSHHLPVCLSVFDLFLGREVSVLSLHAVCLYLLDVKSQEVSLRLTR